MRIYRTEVYLLSFVTAPFDANHWEARGLSLEERHRHLEHLEDVNDHAHKNYCGRRMIPFVADIVYECATDCGRCILPELVARLFFGRALQEQRCKPGERKYRYPVPNGFHSPFPPSPASRRYGVLIDAAALCQRRSRGTGRRIVGISYAGIAKYGATAACPPRCPISGRLGPILAKGRFSPLVAGARPSSMKPIRKAVFPVAGLGTRFLPAPKAIPKEMLPVVDRPLIQYAVDEAREAGIAKMISVTGRGKSAIEDNLHVAFENEKTMSERGKDLSVLEPTRLGPGACAYVRQQEPLGLGHAIWCARDIVGDEPFAIFLPDEFMHGSPGCMKQMVDAYARVGGNVISVLEVPRERVSSYVVIAPGARDGALPDVTALVQKPAVAAARANLII